MKIAIAGNPNCGKSTIFNALTGSKQKVGNWPGVTVEQKTGSFTQNGKKVEVTDLPGIYSLSAFSEDERVSVRFLLSQSVDVVMNVLDSTNIERNLYLTMQLLNLGIPVMVVLNMKDLALKRGIEIELEWLKSKLNTPIYWFSAVDEGDLDALKNMIVEQKPVEGLDFALKLPKAIQDEVELLSPALEEKAKELGLKADWLAQKLLEEEPFFEEILSIQTLFDPELLLQTRKRIEKNFGNPCDVIVAESLYKEISTLVDGAIRRPEMKEGLSAKIDAIVMNKYMGFPFFLFVMYSVFWVTINVGGAFIDFFDMTFGAIFVDGFKVLLEAIHTPVFIVTLLADGVGGGIQTLATFVPIIFMLFVMIAILESTGYMSRAAVVMDRLMRLIGLPGKAFIPLLIGFGCTVPAIMATRTLDNRRDRILTAFMAPFMSCGARMPVYALFAAAFFPQSGQNIVFLIYIIGMVIAAVTGVLLKNTVFKTEPAPFVMELPSYHRPRLKNIFLPAFYKVSSFLKKSGKILVPIMVVLGLLNSMSMDGSFGHEDSKKSVLSTVGRSITPVFAPMGLKEDNWPATVGLFTGLFAKEVIVGTLNSLYMQSDAQAVVGEAEVEESGFDLWTPLGEAFSSIPTNLLALQETLLDPLGLNVGDVETNEAAAEQLAVSNSVFSSMRKQFGTDDKGRAAAFAYLLFVLLYVPCLVAVSAAWKEIGTKLSLIQVYYSTMLAWVLATLYYQVREGDSMFWIMFATSFGLISIWAIVLYAQKSNVFLSESKTEAFESAKVIHTCGPKEDCDCH